MSQKIFRWIIFLITLFSHILALLQFQFKPKYLLLSAEWEGQFYFLLVLSIALSLSLLYFKEKASIWLILFLRSIVIIVVGLPLDGYLVVEQTLLFSFTLEILEYTSLWKGLLYDFGLIMITVGIHSKSIVAWGRILPSASSNDSWSFAITMILFCIINILFRYQQKNQVPKTEIGRLFHEATLQIAQVNIQLQEYAISAEHGAVINERKRIARDLHDITAYTLTNLIMMLEEAKDLAVRGGKDLLDHLDNACEQTKEGLAELRRTIKALRPVNLTVTSGLTAIHQLVTTFNKATQIEIELDLGNAPLNFGEEADLVAYRLVQEGITNALRHGRATKISISFNLINNGVSIHIKDNGIGSSGIQEGYGLTGMRERIERLGGRLEISSQLGEGFRILAWIPVIEEN